MLKSERDRPAWDRDKPLQPFQVSKPESNRGYFRKNKKKRTHLHPDYVGTIWVDVDGQDRECLISAWEGIDSAGGYYISIAAWPRNDGKQ